MSRVLEEAIALAARGEIDAVVALLRNEGRDLWSAARQRRFQGGAYSPHSEDSFEVGDATAHATVFPLRRGTVLPLHDHPSMTVVSKVLHGRMRVESLQWVDRAAGLALHLGVRELGEDSEPFVERDMLHRVAALTDCALLDVFAPYYDDARPCRYYRISERRDGALVSLEQV